MVLNRTFVAGPTPGRVYRWESCIPPLPPGAGDRQRVSHAEGCCKMTETTPFLVRLPFRTYTFDLELRTDRPVSRFLTATLRGGFGYMLRSIVCTTPKADCAKCLLKHNCAYTFLFDTFPPPDAVRMRTYTNIPRPFSFFSTQDGSRITLRLLLVGSAVQYLPYMIYTMNKLGAKGLGKGRMRFAVKSVALDDGALVYPVGDNDVKPDIQPLELQVTAGENAEGTALLMFSSPLVLRKDGKIVREFEPYPFFTTLLRRVTSLATFYAGYTDTDLPAGLLDSARAMEARVDMRFVEVDRYSTRQEARIDYSGMIGTVELTGNIGAVLPLLKAGEMLGVGKNTVFGYGRYTAEVTTE